MSDLWRLVFKKEPLPLTAEETLQLKHERAFQLYEHYRTADRSVARSQDFTHGTHSLLAQKVPTGEELSNPLERLATGRRPFVEAAAPFDQASASTGSLWEKRARFVAFASLQNYLWLGWVEGKPAFVKADYGHTYILGPTGAGKTSLGLAPLICQYLSHKAIPDDFDSKYAQALLHRIQEPILKAFHQLLKNRLHGNLLWRCMGSEGFDPRRYKLLPNGSEVYDHKQTYLWKNQSLLRDTIDSLLLLLDSPPSSGTAPHAPSNEVIRCVFEEKLREYLRLHIPARNKEELLARLVTDTIADIHHVVDGIKSLHNTLCSTTANALATAIKAGADELNVRDIVRQTVQQIVETTPEDVLMPGLQNLLEDSISNEALRLRGEMDPLQGPDYQYAMIVIDLKGDVPLFETVRRAAEREGRTFKFFTPELGKATYTYNPVDGFNYDDTYFGTIAQNMMHGLDLQNQGDQQFFTSEETAWIRRMLQDAYKRGRPVRTLRELSQAATDAVGSGDEEHIRHLRSKLEIISEIQQINVSSPDGINIHQAMRAKEVLYFWLPPEKGGEQVTDLLAKLVLEQISLHADPGYKTLVFIDEFQKIISENVGHFLNQSRSKGVSLFLSNQVLEPLIHAKPPILEAVWGNTDLRIVLEAGTPSTIEFIGKASGTRFETITETSQGGSVQDTINHNATETNSRSSGSAPGGATSNSMNSFATSRGGAHAEGNSHNTTYRKERVPFIDANTMLAVDATAETSVVFVKRSKNAIVAGEEDLKHPIIVRHEFIMTEEENKALATMPWPDTQQYPKAHLFQQIKPSVTGNGKDERDAAEPKEATPPKETRPLDKKKPEPPKRAADTDDEDIRARLLRLKDKKTQPKRPSPGTD